VHLRVYWIVTIERFGSQGVAICVFWVTTPVGTRFCMIYATWNWFTAFATRNSPLRTSFMTSVQHVTHILAHICWLAIEFNWLAIDVRLLCDDQQQLKSGLGSPFTQFESLITHNVLDLSDFGASPYSKWIHISNFFYINAKRNSLYIPLLFHQLSWL